MCESVAPGRVLTPGIGNVATTSKEELIMDLFKRLEAERVAAEPQPAASTPVEQPKPEPAAAQPKTEAP